MRALSVGSMSPIWARWPADASARRSVLEAAGNDAAGLAAAHGHRCRLAGARPEDHWAALGEDRHGARVVEAADAVALGRPQRVLRHRAAAHGSEGAGEAHVAVPV